MRDRSALNSSGRGFISVGQRGARLSERQPAVPLPGKFHFRSRLPTRALHHLLCASLRRGGLRRRQQIFWKRARQRGTLSGGST